MRISQLGALLVACACIFFAGCGPELVTPQADTQRVAKEIEYQQELAQRYKPWTEKYILDSGTKTEELLCHKVQYSLARASVGIRKVKTEPLAGIGAWFTMDLPYRYPELRPLIERGELNRSIPELIVLEVAKGSAAERAGLMPGDVVVEAAGRRLLGIRKDPKVTNAYLVRIFSAFGKPAPIKVMRVANGEARILDLEITPEEASPIDVRYKDDNVINAWTDGKAIYITKGILEWLLTTPEPEEYLASIVSHEYAHIMLGHNKKATLRAMVGGALGLSLDIAAAGAGINTRGVFSKLGAGIGILTFSKSEEREADYMMMYLLARAGYEYHKAPEVFRELAVVSPESIKGGYLSTHPGTAERYVYLEQTANEIDEQLASGVARSELEPRYKEEKKKEEEEAAQKEAEG